MYNDVYIHTVRKKYGYIDINKVNIWIRLFE